MMIYSYFLPLFFLSFFFPPSLLVPTLEADHHAFPSMMSRARKFSWLAIGSPSSSHSHISPQDRHLLQHPERTIRSRIPRPRHGATGLQDLGLKAILLVDPALILAQHGAAQTGLPRAKEGVFALGDELAVAAVVETAAVGELLRGDLPAAGQEPEVGPAEEPEAGQVEEPADVPGVAGGVLPARRGDREAVVRRGESDLHLPAVVGRAHEGGEEVREVGPRRGG